MDNFLSGWAEFMYDEHKLKVESVDHVEQEKYGTYLYLDNNNIIGMNFEEGYQYDVCIYDLLDKNKVKIKHLGSTLV